MLADRRPLIAGNWKMNGLRADGLARAQRLRALVREGAACDILVCPPATLVHAIAAALAESSIATGGQDCHAEAAGAHTGDVSAEMLADAGCAYVIVGHSERRADHGEDDAIVRAKAEAAWRAGLTAIICLGESEAERDAGRALDVVAAQLAGSLPDAATPANTVIAYEPVWAIGTGRVAGIDDIAAVHGHLRDRLRARFGAAGQGFRILYGGSVKPDNAAAILALENVDGALVGGASLDADAFWAICRSAP